jgi:hypothetical protein
MLYQLSYAGRPPAKPQVSLIAPRAQIADPHASGAKPELRVPAQHLPARLGLGKDKAGMI